MRISDKLKNQASVKHRFQPGHRKPSSGTVGHACSGSGSMTVNSAFRNPVPVLQKPNQLHKRLHLSRSRRCVVEITHKADSYPFFVPPVVRCLTMCPRNLPSPAKRDLNLAVTTISAVTYNKIVCDTIPMVFFSVFLVKYCHISVTRCRVMYYDSFPFSFQP